MRKKTLLQCRRAGATLASTVALALLLPAAAGAAEGWDIAGFVENDSHFRDGRGMTKFRNTAQLEFSRGLRSEGRISGLTLKGTLRATYDGVYDLNDDEFGDKAGGPVMMESLGGPIPPPFQPAFGGLTAIAPGPVEYAGVGAPPSPPPPTLNPPVGLAGTPGPAAGASPFWSPGPNDGLELLGAQLHQTDGGVALAVPVRPCDEDSRGCIDGYMDADSDDLRFPDFNERADFIRELYISGAYALDSGAEVGFKVGKQQIVWGRTDLFRVLDVINPVDYSRNNIYDELEDIRIPMWIAELEYRWGATETFDDLNLALVWNFDKFRPNNLGQGGTPNAILDAGSFFRAMNNCWENGCTVGNFAFGHSATNFGPGQIGIREAHMPDWDLDNTQLGVKLEGLLKGVGFSVNALYFRSQLPSLRGGIESIDPFAGGAPAVYPYSLAFDIHFPRVMLLGGSLDWYVDPLKSAFRFEVAHTSGEEFPNTLEPDLFSESDVLRWVLGIDRSTFIPFLNRSRAFLISGQVFGQHLLDHEEVRGPAGLVGMPDWEDNYVATLLIKGWYQNDRVSPQIIFAHDFEAGAWVAEPSLDWLISDAWRLTVKANFKWGDGAHKYDDNRSAMPYPALWATAGFTEAQMSAGLGGYEPLGRFRAGPIGMAKAEDQVMVTLRYRF